MSVDSIGRSGASPRLRSTPSSCASAWSYGWHCSRGGGSCGSCLQLMAIGLIGTALVLESQRSALVIVVFALGAMAAARTGRRPTGAILAGAFFLLVLYFGVSQFASTSDTQATATNSVSALTSHLVSGIANPTGQQSTLPGHFSRVESGIASGFTEPIGHGTGSITLAASNLAMRLCSVPNSTRATRRWRSDSLDCCSISLSLGRGLSTVYRLAALRRDPLSIAVLGVAGVNPLPVVERGSLLGRLAVLVDSGLGRSRDLEEPGCDRLRRHA